MTFLDLALPAWAGAAAVFALVLWPLSLRRRDASIVDFWWGPGMAAMAVAVWLMAGRPAGAHAALAAGLVTLWGLRLGFALGARRLRETEEDPRYRALRAAWAPGYWWKSLFVVFLLQALLQGLVVSGALAAIAAPATALGWLGAAGAMVAALGLMLESTADRQLDRFRAAAPHRALCRSGLRAHVRFPHYAGEILFWAGIAALALDAGVWWAPAPALLMAALLAKVSGAPMMDEHLAATRPDYAAWRAETPAFLPDLRRLGAAARRADG
mgnify:CR=1 FL=1